MSCLPAGSSGAPPTSPAPVTGLTDLQIRALAAAAPAHADPRLASLLPAPFTGRSPSPGQELVHSPEVLGFRAGVVAERASDQVLRSERRPEVGSPPRSAYRRAAAKVACR